MLRTSCPAAGHYRNADSIGNGARHGQVVTRLGAVRVHRCQDNLTGPELFHTARPCHCPKPGRYTAAVYVDFPKLTTIPENPPRIDVDDRCTPAKLPRYGCDELWSAHGGRVNADLFGSCLDQSRRVFERADAA